MNIFAIISSIILVCATFTNAQGGAEITGQAATDAVILQWEPVENVTHYYVSLSDGAAQLITDHKVIFQNLTARTEYTATVTVSDDYGNVLYVLGEIAFKTLSPKVANVKIKYAAKDYIEVIWDEVDYAIGYSVVVKNAYHDLIHPQIDLRGNKVTVSGLEAASHYYIYIIALDNHGESEPAVIMGRTDGTGVKVNFWAGMYGDIHGGEVTVYRPLKIPIGPYTVKVNFGCPLKSVEVWNAKFDEAASDLYTGMVVTHQKLQWEKEKTMIMMNFYPLSNGTYCEITNTSVTALFGDDATTAAGLDNQPTINTDIKTTSYEWLTTNRVTVNQSGIIQIKMKEYYNDSHLEDPLNPKPAEGTYIIAVNAGDDCSGGLIINKPWGMTQKSSEGMAGATPQTVYFTQIGNEWYSNEPGFIYGYDPRTCTDRSHITAQVMKGGPFVRAVMAAEDVVFDGY